MTAWESIMGDFTWDLGLRDLYVFNTSITDWNQLIHSLEQSPYELKFYYNNEPTTSSPNLNNYFANRNQELTLLLSVHTKNIIINSHFFHENEIEFDIDPRQVTNQEQLNTLVHFMQFVADTLNKEVSLTYENSPESLILRVTPSSSR